MTTPVDEAIRRYAAALEIRDWAEGAVRKRVDAVGRALAGSLKLDDLHLIGSYQRQTLIAPLSAGAVDVLAVMNHRQHSVWHNTEGVDLVLSRYHRLLAAAFPRQPVQRLNQAILVPFKDIRLCVYPAYAWHTGGYVFTDGARLAWLHADPEQFAGLMRQLDYQHERLVYPLIRLVRAWNRQAGGLLTGFHIECLIERHLTAMGYPNSRFDSLRAGLVRFMTVLPDLLCDPCQEPIHDQVIDHYLGDRPRDGNPREQAIDAAEKAAFALAAAEPLTASGKIEAALAQWRLVLGPGVA